MVLYCLSMYTFLPYPNRIDTGGALQARHFSRINIDLPDRLARTVRKGSTKTRTLSKDHIAQHSRAHSLLQSLRLILEV